MLNYKLFAITSVLAFTAGGQSTYASAPQVKIYPNKGCLLVVEDLGDSCKVQAIVDDEGAVDWYAEFFKNSPSGECTTANLTHAGLSKYSDESVGTFLYKTEGSPEDHGTARFKSLYKDEVYFLSPAGWKICEGMPTVKFPEKQ